jgi:hypothetical protein
MPCHARSTSAPARRRFPKPSTSPPPRPSVTLNLELPAERQAHDYLLRISTGRWPTWRLLGMARDGAALLVAVLWLRMHRQLPYSLVELDVDSHKFGVRWLDYGTAAEVRAELRRRATAAPKVEARDV